MLSALARAAERRRRLAAPTVAQKGQLKVACIRKLTVTDPFRQAVQRSLVSGIRWLCVSLAQLFQLGIAVETLQARHACCCR